MRLWILPALVMMTATAHAQDAPDCGKFKWSVKREVAWIAAGPTPVAADAAITLEEKAYRVTLDPTDKIKFAVPPERAAKPGAFAAALTFDVAKSGDYDVGLSSEGWIDVVQGGAIVKSSEFSGQKTCRQLRKSVRFKLAAGASTLQLSNLPGQTVDVAIAPAP